MLSVALAVVAMALCAQAAWAQATQTAGAQGQPKAPAAQPAAETKAAEEAKPPDSRLCLIDPEAAKRFEEWNKKVKQPVPWFKWGADLRLREKWGVYWTTLNKHAPRASGDERHFERYRARIWGTLTPIPDVDLNARLVWEPRVIQKGPWPPSSDVVHSRQIWQEALFDQLNVVWRNIGGLPLTITAGRQDIILGNGWLVLDGTPLDGSRTIFFDAVRFNYNWKEANTTFDGIYIDNDFEGDRYLKPFDHTGQNLIEQDERGAIFYVTNKSLPKTEINGYYIYKHDTPKQAVVGYDSETHTIGGRIAGDFGDNWKYYAEGAHQWGKRNSESISAYAFNSKLVYLCKDALSNQFRVGYEFLSGDDPGSHKNEMFDPLWGRWPQWSELYVYTVTLDNPGRPGQVTNFHRLGGGWTCSPAKNLEWSNDYHLLFCDENTRGSSAGFSEHGTFRGQLLTSVLKYKFNDHVSTHVWTEFFFPGNYYADSRNDPAVLVRYELCFTW